MRLVALTAAAALLGTGCFVSTSDTVPPGRVGDANVFWSFLRFAPATSLAGVEYDASLGGVPTSPGVCPESGVDTVRVSSAAGTVDVTCTEAIGGGRYSQGITIFNLPEGPNGVTLTGYRSGTAVYRSSFTVNVVANSTVDRTVAVQGIGAALDVYAYLTFGLSNTDYLTCGGAGNPNVDYWIWDSFGTLVEQGSSGCSNPLPTFTFTGVLDLDNYTVRLQGTPPGGSLAFDSCSVGRNHFQAQTGAGGWTVDLFSSPLPVCP